MNKKNTSIYAQVAYMLISGLQLLFVPNLLLSLFGFDPTNEIWIRVLGLLVVVVSSFYYIAAKENYTKIIKFTVYERLTFCAGLVIFVFLGMAKPALILFAALEACLAIWTYFEQKKN